MKNIEIRVLCFLFIMIYKLLKNLLKYAGYEGWARDEGFFFVIVFTAAKRQSVTGIWSLVNHFSLMTNCPTGKF